ncbi:DHHA1 domain-containing protein [soil metagenome]
MSSRNILIVVSEAAKWPGAVRSGDREIVRWDGARLGDPTDAANYSWTAQAGSVTAVLDVQPPDRARQVLRALRSVRHDAAVLLLSHDVSDVDGPGDGTLARAGALRDVLRLDLEEELERLEAERRAFCLREFAAGDDVVPILIHDDPDPDAVSSALAVMALLGNDAQRTPIVTLDEMTRAENRRMADLLHIRVTQVTLEELRAFERVITVDTQPRQLQQDGRPRLAVIDHHPVEAGYTAEFADVRPTCGATATMMTQYLRATEGVRINSTLATALLFGIRTDTDSLMRGVTPADVEAYAFLQEHADTQLIRRFERPSYPMETAKAFGRALERAEYDDDLCVAYLGELVEAQSHVLADLADFCLGIETITWVAVAAVLEGELVITLRHAGGAPGAGAVARAIAASTGGRGGGHATMARVSLPASALNTVLGEAHVTAAIMTRLRETIDGARDEVSRPGSHPVHQA